MLKNKSWSKAEVARVVNEINDCNGNKENIKWTYNILAEEYGVTPNAVYNQYHTVTHKKLVINNTNNKHMELHSGSIMSHNVASINPSTKKTSRFWSKAEVRKLLFIIKSHPDTRAGRGDGVREAAKYFGVSTSSISARYYHCIHNSRKGRINRNTTKVPISNKPRKSMKYKSRNETFIVSRGPGKVVPMSVMVKTPELRSLTFDIQDVKVDVENKKLTILF